MATTIHQDWLFRYNHETNRDEQTPGMCTTINVIKSCMDVPIFMTAKEIRMVILDDEHLDILEN